MAVPMKRKRVVLNMKQKLDIIERLSKGESSSMLAREYNVGKSSIASIRSSKDTLLSYVSALESKDGMLKRKTMKNAVNKELEEMIFDWYMQKRTSREPITGPMICEKALEINNRIGGSSSFKASNGWLKNFKSRHGVKMIEYTSERYSNSLPTHTNQEANNVILPDICTPPNYEIPTPSTSQNKLHDDDTIDTESSNSDDANSPSDQEAFYAIGTVLEWYEKQLNCDTEMLINLSKLRYLAYVKAMSVAFSSNDSEAIQRTIAVCATQNHDESFTVDDAYEIARCVRWIESNNFSKVALQFPDELLDDSTKVVMALEAQTGKQIFVLGDTTYSSCCVDEIAAEHASADGIIHYGRCCLSPTRRLPVLYVFGKHPIEVQSVAGEFKKLIPDTDSRIVILYEVIYQHAIENIVEHLKEYKNIVISQLQIPGSENNGESDSCSKITKCRRIFHIPRSDDATNYSMFYVGSQNQTLMNFMLTFNHCKFYSYNPVNKCAMLETLDVNRYLRKRYYYIEKAKDAKIVGILVGTLGVEDYLSIIKHLQKLIVAAGKKGYTLAVGKLNSAKLANFAEVEVFVYVSCAESSLIDCRDFYQPIVTPYELEIACNKARQWTGDYLTDFGELIPGAVGYLPPTDIKTESVDVSLVTGKIRCIGKPDPDVMESDSSEAIVPLQDMTVSTLHSRAAGEFLHNRTWKGLEQHLGETPVCDIVEGHKGVASQYEDEGLASKD